MPINKCIHGVYIPAGEARAIYCQICSPDAPTDTKDVVLPRSSGDPLSNAGRMLANGHSTGCPACGSAIYLRVNEKNDTRRECADCGELFTARLTTHQRALLAREAANEQPEL